MTVDFRYRAVPRGPPPGRHETRLMLETLEGPAYTDIRCDNGPAVDGATVRQAISSPPGAVRRRRGLRDCTPGPHRTVPSCQPPITTFLEGLRLSARNGTDTDNDKGHDPMSGRDSPTCRATCRDGRKRSIPSGVSRASNRSLR